MLFLNKNLIFNNVVARFCNIVDEFIIDINYNGTKHTFNDKNSFRINDMNRTSSQNKSRYLSFFLGIIQEKVRSKLFKGHAFCYNIVIINGALYVSNVHFYYT